MADSGGLAQILQGLFGNSGDKFTNAGREYNKYSDQASGYQQPFYDEGQKGLKNYSDWAGGMKDPTKFINSLMDNYNESPYAKFQKNQGQNAINNASSASGMTGSSAMNQASADYAQNITSGDQQNWLKNVLGINTEYGDSQKGLADMGQHAGDMLSQIKEKLAEYMGGVAYGDKQGRDKDFGNLINGLFGGGMGGGGGDGGGGGGGGGGGAELLQLLSLLGM